MEVIIDGATYKTERLDTFVQLHIVRRLTPVLPGLIASIAEVDITKLSAGQVLVLAAGPVGQAMAYMPQEDADYIVKSCLAVCFKLDSNAAAPLMKNGRLMYADMSLKAVMQLVVAVIKENLSDFLPVGGTTT